MYLQKYSNYVTICQCMYCESYPKQEKWEISEGLVWLRKGFEEGSTFSPLHYSRRQ